MTVNDSDFIERALNLYTEYVNTNGFKNSIYNDENFLYHRMNTYLVLRELQQQYY